MEKFVYGGIRQIDFGNIYKPWVTILKKHLKIIVPTVCWVNFNNPTILKKKT